MTTVPPSSPSQLKSRLLSSAATGGITGLSVALVDTIYARAYLQHLSEIVLVFLQSAGRLAPFAAVLAGFVALATWGGEQWSRRHGTTARRGRNLSALLVGALFLPGAVYVSVRLFHGGRMSQLPSRNLLMVAAVVLLAALLFVAVRIALSVLARADAKGRVSAWIVIQALAFLAVALIAHYFDGHFYRRLYLYLHGVLGLITLAGVGIAVRLLLPLRRVSVLGRPFQLGILGLSGVLLIAAASTFDLRQTVKVAAFEHTATTANLLHLFTRTGAASRRGKPSDKIIALREARAARARSALEGSFPVFPGAHVLLISVDALRADRLGVLGNKKRDLTPNLDRWITRSGVNFERAYCSAPHSSFSITGMHISRYPHVEALLNKEMTYPTLAEVLKREGYQTMGFFTQGIFFTDGEKVAHYQQNRFGLDAAVGGAPPPDELTDRVIAEIDRAVLKGEPPLFLWVHYFNVHEPYRSTTFGTAPVDRYDGEVAAMDPEVVRLIEHAEAVLTKGVVVAFTADHGEEFKEHGGYYHGSTVYDEQVRVPLVFSVPGGTPRRVASPVSNVSAAPTLLRLVGIAPAPSMMGRDLRPAIFGGNAAHVEEPVFASVVNEHMVLRWPWKFISDPSIRRFQLYNLEKDPAERFNVYDSNRDLAEELLGEIEGFLDEIGKGEHEGKTVLNLGHMRDPRAVPGLVSLVSNPGAPVADRMEAAELLGSINDDSVIPLLEKTLNDGSDAVALAAALSLAKLGNLKGRDLLHEALFDPDPEIRDKVALALGEHGDRAATPQLIEALGRNDVRIREKAIKALGIVRDPEAVEPLIDALIELRSRYLTVNTLGKIQDPRAFEPLMRVLEEDDRTDVRGYTVVALGYLGKQEAIPALLEILEEEPEIKWTPESLVRLGAVGAPPLFGTDVAKGAPALTRGWGRCTENQEILQYQYMERTTCASTGPRAELTFEADITGKAIAILRARYVTAKPGRTSQLALDFNGTTVGQVVLIPKFQEFRIDVPAEMFRSGAENNTVTLALTGPGRFEVDHLLVLSVDDE